MILKIKAKIETLSKEYEKSKEEYNKLNKEYKLKINSKYLPQINDLLKGEKELLEIYEKYGKYDIENEFSGILKLLLKSEEEIQNLILKNEEEKRQMQKNREKPFFVEEFDGFIYPGDFSDELEYEINKLKYLKPKIKELKNKEKQEKIKKLLECVDRSYDEGAELDVILLGLGDLTRKIKTFFYAKQILLKFLLEVYLENTGEIYELLLKKYLEKYLKGKNINKAESKLVNLYFKNKEKLKEALFLHKISSKELELDQELKIFVEDNYELLNMYVKSDKQAQNTFLFKLSEEEDKFEEEMKKLFGNPRPKHIQEELNKVKIKNFNKLFLKIIDNYFNEEYDLYQKRFSILKLLEKFGTQNKKIVIIGENGSGKSTLASFLKNSDFENITVIPPQKILYYISESDLEYETKKSIAEFQKKDYKKEYSKDLTHHTNILELIQMFTKTVKGLKNEHIKTLSNRHENNQDNNRDTDFDVFKSIVKEILPDINFKIVDGQEIIVEKQDEEYEINNLSDGEKAVVFYTIMVLFAKKDNYIIIDEPETFLNSAISERLWKLLSEKREDCQFVFISHNIEFITSLDNVQKLWCKKFVNFENFRIETIDENEIGLPSELVAQLVGNRKKVLFCEGEKSLDYKLFSQLFGKEYNVYSVGGSSDVKKFTRAYNKIKNVWIGEAIGIIDRDFLDENKIENIHPLPYNEIETLLTDLELIDDFFKFIKFKGDKNKKKLEYLIKLLDKIRQPKIKYELSIDRFDKRVTQKLEYSNMKAKKEINSSNIKDTKDLNQKLKEYFDKIISEFNINDEITKIESIFIKIEEMSSELLKKSQEENYELSSKDKEDYEQILEICTKEILNDVVKCIEKKNYFDKVIDMFSQNDDLKEKYREKWFPDIKMK